ncbi:MAG: hypothetical protein IJ011_01455 [Clostridia bacterium]|nr:hypothetical protein [Clostridia bacterium]
MKQLGNLAIVCATKKDVLLQIHNGVVSVHYGAGPTRETATAKWDDDVAIRKIVKELNFGKETEHRKESEAA